VNAYSVKAGWLFLFVQSELADFVADVATWRTCQNICVVFDFCQFVVLCENMTVVFELRERTDKQTDRRTDTPIAILPISTASEVINQR